MLPCALDIFYHYTTPDLHTSISADDDEHCYATIHALAGRAILLGRGTSGIPQPDLNTSHRCSLVYRCIQPIPLLTSTNPSYLSPLQDDIVVTHRTASTPHGSSFIYTRFHRRLSTVLLP